MKRLMMMLLLCGAFTFSFAQRGPKKPESVEKRIENAKQELDLSDDQVAQWIEIHEKYEEEIKAARDNRDREKGEEIRETMGAELEATLTDEQKEKFKEMQKKRPRRGPRGKG